MRTLLIAALFAFTASAELKRLHFDERVDLNGNREYGKAGPYERIAANGSYGDAAPFHIEVIKPRDPARGNNALIFLTGKGPTDQALMDAGFTIIRMKENDPAAMRALVSFLRYGGEPFVLGDQRRFLKRFIAYAGDKDAAVLQRYAQGGNVDEKNRKLFDVLWLHDSGIKIEPQNDLKIHLTRGKPIDALALELDNSLKGQ